MKDKLQNLDNKVLIFRNKKYSKNQIIAKAYNSQLEGKLEEAANYYKCLIENGVYDSKVFVNFGIIIYWRSNLLKFDFGLSSTTFRNRGYFFP